MSQNQTEQQPQEYKKKSNARLALMIALIPVLLFVMSFFIRR